MAFCFQVAKKASVLKRRKSRQKLDTTNPDAMLTEEHFMENSADPSTKSSVGKLFGDLTYISTRIVFLKENFLL